MIGPIRGTRLSAEIKLKIVRAVHAAKVAGVPIERACGVIMLDPRRLRRWIEHARICPAFGSTSSATRPPEGSERQVLVQAASGRARIDVATLTEAHLIDHPPVARVRSHALTFAERKEIVRAADEDALAHLRHRKLTHHLSRTERVWCSESSVLRVLREAGKVPRYLRRHRPERPRPQVGASHPNAVWDYDLTSFPTRAGDYHLVPVIDRCSRKITGRHFGPEADSAAVQTAWGKALASEGLLAEEAPAMPGAHSDRGTQMTSRSTRTFFVDLGIAQTYSRPRTPTDNAAAESWMATLKCERLYEADTQEMTPDEVETMIDRFIDYYNNERLHQSLGFVTPAERHEGRHTVIIAARKEGMRRAREMRKMVAYEGTGEAR